MGMKLSHSFLYHFQTLSVHTKESDVVYWALDRLVLWSPWFMLSFTTRPTNIRFPEILLSCPTFQAISKEDVAQHVLCPWSAVLVYSMTKGI